MPLPLITSLETTRSMSRELPHLVRAKFANLLYIYPKYVFNTGTCTTPCARWHHQKFREYWAREANEGVTSS